MERTKFIDDEEDLRLEDGNGSFPFQEPLPFDACTPEQAPAEAEADFVPLASVEGPEAQPALEEIDPFQWDSLQASQAFDRAVTAAAEGNVPEAMQLYIRAAKIAETAHEWYLAAAASRQVGDYLLAAGPWRDVERAFRMYRRAVAAYERCGLAAEARDLSYHEMCLRMHSAGRLGLSITHRIELFLFWATAGFGYRPLRVLGTAGVIVLIYALIYGLTGGVIRTTDGALVRSFSEMIYFSGITFSTIGYGDYRPVPQQHFIALSEGALGIALLGFFVAVLANRLSRS
jgi:hypothetical protein